MNSRPDFLSTLPNDAVGVITNYVDPVSMINLDLTARRYHTFFNQNDFAKLKIIDARKIVNQFFTLVAFALLKLPDKNDNSILVPVLENFLKLYPELLTYRITVQCNPKIKLVDRTAYQITLAYAADNIYPMMQKHFLRLPNGEEEMNKQFKEQFPDGIIKAYPKYDIEKARRAFHNAKELIQMDTCISYKNGEDFHFLEVMSDNTRKVINEFFTIITSDNEYTIGLVNDMQLYNEGVNIYYDDKESNKFKGWAQRDAYCVFMLGGLQALFTPNILQVLLQGANKVIDQKEALAYVTKTCFRGTDVSPFNPCSQFRLGEHFFIGGVAEGRTGGPPCPRPGGGGAPTWKNFVEQKQLALNNLCSDSSPQTCVLKK